MDTIKHEYIELLKKCLTHSLWPDAFSILKKSKHRGSPRQGLRNFLLGMLEKRGLFLVKRNSAEPSVYEEGRGWPQYAETMIGFKRLDNLQYCVEDILQRNVPGDFIETGVWRGGAVIFLRALLRVHGDTDRVVWAADSFAGLPEPDERKYPGDKGDEHYKWDELKVSLEDVKHNFAKYGLLDERVKFLQGWFKDTLPQAPIDKLALLRMDGDIYESTMDALVHLYPKLSVGGFVIVDDYHNKSCADAVADYRKAHGIDEEIKKIDWTGAFWKREK